MDFALAALLAGVVAFWGVMIYAFILSMPTEDADPEIVAAPHARPMAPVSAGA